MTHQPWQGRVKCVWSLGLCLQTSGLHMWSSVSISVGGNMLQQLFPCNTFFTDKSHKPQKYFNLTPPLPKKEGYYQVYFFFKSWKKCSISIKLKSSKTESFRLLKRGKHRTIFHCFVSCCPRPKAHRMSLCTSPSKSVPLIPCFSHSRLP